MRSGSTAMVTSVSSDLRRASIAQLRIAHRADRHSLQLHGIAGLHATQVATEARDVHELLAAGLALGRALVVEQLEHRALLARRSGERHRRRFERDAARDQLLPRVGANAHALRPDREIETTRIPETGLGVHQPVVRSTNENGDGQLPAFGPE